MSPQSAGTDVLLLTSSACVGSFVGVKALVKLQMNELGEFGWTQITGVRFLSGVES